MCGAKSRGNWNLGMCLKNCANRGEEYCEECFRFSKFKEKKDADCDDAV